MPSRRLASLLLSVAVALMAGCAKINDRASWLFSSSIDAIAIVNAQLLQGQVQLLTDRTGKVSLSAANQTTTSCMGSLRFSGTTAGVINLRCNDGTSADLQFALLSEAKGYAYGQTALGPVSLTFGLSVAESKAYLQVPPNRKLVEVGKDRTLGLE